MSINQMAAYDRQISRNTPSRSSLPDWINEGLPFPFHPQYKVLLDAYQQAKAEHFEAVNVMQFAVQRRVENPDVQHSQESLEECRKEEERTRKALSMAEQALRQFISHTPEDRIKLIEAEIADLETQLLDSFAEENAYVQHLLDDPNAQRNRLSKIAHGYTSAQAEYSDEQLAELRRLRSVVETLEAQILESRRSIQEIHRLTLEQQRWEETQEAIAPVVAKFNQACSTLLTSMQELDAIAAKYGVRVIKPNDLHISTSAVLDQVHNLIRIHGK